MAKQKDEPQAEPTEAERLALAASDLKPNDILDLLVESVVEGHSLHFPLLRAYIALIREKAAELSKKGA